MGVFHTLIKQIATSFIPLAAILAKRHLQSEYDELSQKEETSIQIIHAFIPDAEHIPIDMLNYKDKTNTKSLLSESSATKIQTRINVKGDN